MDCLSEIDELIRKKAEEVSKLNHEYQELLKSRQPISDTETEDLRSKLFELMAEVQYLKENEPEIIPKCDADLYDWVRQSAEEDIEQKRKLLFDLDKMHEDSSMKRELMLEDEKSKNKELHCLHRKMVRRLRRLSRRIPTPKQETLLATRVTRRSSRQIPTLKQKTLLATPEKVNESTRDTTGNVVIRSFYRVLKEFVVELQDRNFESEDWDNSQIVSIDNTYSPEHIQLLASANIIQKSTNYPLSYCLKTTIDTNKDL